MVVVPTPKVMAAEGLPDVTAMLLTITVAVASSVVGVTVMVDTLLATLSVSVVGTVWPCARPALVLKLSNLSFADCASVTTRVYVLVLLSAAVTTMVMVFVPGDMVTAVAAPDGAVVPLMVSVAVGSATVGVTVRVAPLPTPAVKLVAVPKAGERVPLLKVRLARLSFADAARVTVRV